MIEGYTETVELLSKTKSMEFEMSVGDFINSSKRVEMYSGIVEDISTDEERIEIKLKDRLREIIIELRYVYKFKAKQDELTKEVEVIFVDGSKFEIKLTY